MAIFGVNDFHRDLFHVKRANERTHERDGDRWASLVSLVDGWIGEQIYCVIRLLMNKKKQKQQRHKHRESSPFHAITAERPLTSCLVVLSGMMVRVFNARTLSLSLHCCRGTYHPIVFVFILESFRDSRGFYYFQQWIEVASAVFIQNKCFFFTIIIFVVVDRRRSCCRCWCWCCVCVFFRCF